jgi:hypothetical protein
MPEGRRIITKNEIEAIAAYDVEQVLLQIEKWADARCGVQLAPFGPKPHAVAMALYASQGVDMPLIYAQPRLYNPPYSFGSGDCYGYVVKWDFIAAYDRKDMGPAR